jgi:hypothetical protein
MQPQQPEAPSTQAPADTQAQGQVSEQEEAPSRASSWLRRLWRGRGDEAEETSPSQEPQPQQPASDRIVLTQEELDRRVQAETDRRESKRLEQAQAERRRRLRDEDPWAYAEEERNAEAVQRTDATVTNMFAQAGTTHDRYTLDPLVQSLPDAERDRILRMEGAGVGLDGRKLIVDESLRALERHWKQEGAKEAENKLRRNPAFRKQVLGEFRRGMPEPEYIGSGNSTSADKDMSEILRQQIRARH